MEIDGVVRVITKRDGTLTINRGVRHQFWRADRDAGAKGDEDQLLGVTKDELKQDLIIIESTDPADRDKEVFSRQVSEFVRGDEGEWGSGDSLDAVELFWCFMGTVIIQW